MKTKEEKRYQIFSNIIMIILSACAIIPLILLVISSFTDNDTLIRNGYSFVPEKFSLYAYEYIFNTGNSVIHAYGVSILLTVVGTT
ncbi:MAG: carbohydrate ABC transporter permease, partial [Mobilitalea sp.]